MPATLAKRFEQKYIGEPNSGCWIWIGAVGSNGYGHIWIGKGVAPSWCYAPAHRVSWELHRGPIPEGMCVLHRCDNPYCVNPDHLFVGTHRDNKADCVRKKRHAHSAGGNHPGIKLSLDDVIAIRASKDSHTHLARQFGVTASHICSIRKGRERTGG